ncbi:MAG TPA: 7TM-DISM domain-containing protein [Oligoflexus sp.]|uniref:7TM-DISM domain-containing protein n=1 Tax=Oligoflexus sp. TaxID=1971216 RepID=UPI002D3423F0|nr:7TM-DISM domain-containing protein [Oligoflexus sp.]HYX34732.1 7TM-DISM domain-containing protein [Oligoflexus sp.]
MIKMLVSLWILIFCSGLSEATALNPILLDASKEDIVIGPSSFVYEDASKELDLAAAQKLWNDHGFRQETAKDPNFGFTGHAYWYRFSARNQADHRVEWYFGLEYPLIKDVDLYVSNPDGTYSHQETGNSHDFGKRDLKNRFMYLKVPFAAGEQKDFYLRLQTNGASEFRMRFRDLAGIYLADHDIQFYMGGVNLLMLVLATYYLLLSLNSREKDVLWMGLFLASQFLFRMTVNGFSFEYMFAHSPALNQYAVGLTVPLVFGTAMANAHYFLPMHQYRRLSYVTRSFIGLNFLFVCLSFFLPYRFIKVYTLVGLLTAFAIILISFYSRTKGFRPARYFVYSWTLVLIGSIAFGLQKLGVIPVSFFTIYGVEISLVIQAVLMSLGVSDKINDTNKKMQRAQEDALKAQVETNRLQEVMNTQLEQQVRERTEELWNQTKGMTVILENLNQGICKIDGSYSIHSQYSPFLEKILEHEELGDKSLSTLLFSHAEMNHETHSLMDTTVASAVGEPSFQFEANSHLLPRNIIYKTKHLAKHLEIDWAAIEDKEGAVDRLLVAIRDVSEMKKIEQEAEEKREVLEAIGKILDLSASKFRRFIKSSSLLIEESRQKVDEDLSAESWRVLLRNVHTIKGNARTYKLDDLSALVHEVENDLFAVDANKLKSEHLKLCFDSLAKIETKIGFYQNIHDDKLKRGAVAETENLIVQASKMMSDVWSGLNPKKKHQYYPMLQKFDALNTNSLKKAIIPLIDSLPSLAKQLNKSAPEVKIQGGDFFVDPDHLNLFEDIFVHMFRNSLDHGFMLGDEGRIRIDIRFQPEQTEIVYFDNGRGLNLAVLRKKALERGLVTEAASDHDVAVTIFMAGVSSAKTVTEISGRGVGMDAVRGCIERLRGTIAVRLLGEGSLPHHQRFEFVIILPPQVPMLQTLDFQQAA